MMPPGAMPAMNAPAPTNDGSTSGRTSATRQARRKGRSVRTVIHASNVPMNAVVTETRVASCSVRHSGPRISSQVSPNGASSEITCTTT